MDMKNEQMKITEDYMKRSEKIYNYLIGYNMIRTKMHDKVNYIGDLSKHYWAMVYSNHYGEIYVEWEQYLIENYPDSYKYLTEGF